MKREIDIKTTSSRYSAYVGDHILETYLKQVLAKYSSDKIFVLIDENVFNHHWEYISGLLGTLSDDISHMIVPQGEQSKSIEFWPETIDFILNNGARRNTPLLAIGGGVTGDLGGFAAATALRGIPLIHIPTTLLAMVDSAIGGKTGINHISGKNLIGSFYQPKAVIADVHFLNTLPKKEWINGLSEILKYAAIKNINIFETSEMFLNQNFGEMNRPALISLISTCIKIKADIVEQDEFEAGPRAFLNFGHTFAHALEKACDFNTISHGEAVFLGMLAAQKLSVLTGSNLPENYLDKFRSLYSYNVSKDNLSSKKLNNYMLSDKKRTGDEITFVLLEGWQYPVVKTVSDRTLIDTAWQIIFDEL